MTWESKHETLLGMLAAARESLTDIAHGADLDEIETALEALDSAIEISNDRKMEEDYDDEEEDKDEETEEDEDEEE